MSMTRTDFEALADALANVRPPKRRHAAYKQWLASMHAVADVCSDANYNFQRARFLTTCIERQSYAA